MARTYARTVRGPSGWIGVDLDGTLAHYSGWNGGAIGQPVQAMVTRVEGWIAQGLDVRIFTARVAASGMTKWSGEIDSDEFANDQRRLIQDWTEKHLGVRLPVTATKDFRMLSLWDDRAVSIEKNTGEIKRNDA